MTADPTFLGSVADVSGATVAVELAPEVASGLLFVRGHAYGVGQVGGFVRVAVGLTSLIGVVSRAGAGAAPRTHEASSAALGRRWLTVELVGTTSESRFERGIAVLPTVGDPVHVVTDQDLRSIYGDGGDSSRLRVGQVASADSIPALIDPDMLVTRHSAIVGTTGSGKSTTVARLLQSLTSEGFQSARVLLFDPHGEYATALGSRAKALRATTSDKQAALHIPYWALTFDELVPLTFGQLDDNGRAAVRDEVVRLKRAALTRMPHQPLDAGQVTADTPVPFSIHQLWYDLYRLVNATHLVGPQSQTRDTEALQRDPGGVILDEGDPMAVRPPLYESATQAAGATKVYLSGSPLNIRRQVDLLGSRLRDGRFAFLFRPGPWSVDPDGTCGADLDALLEIWVGASEPVTILDMSAAPSEVFPHLVGALTRVLYDAMYWARRLSEGGRERPLLFVFEEAHSYLSGTDTVAAAAVRRVVKEGRKYGIGAMVVSQRPSEVDTTVLSQCGTTIALRMSNSADRAHVSGSTSDNLSGLLGLLPSLRTGEALIIGEAVPLPMRVLVEPPGVLPESTDARVRGNGHPGGWDRGREPAVYAEVVACWRTSDPASPHVLTEAAMERVSVDSSNIVAVGYDRDSSVMEVEFRGGSVYQYFDVPEAVFDLVTHAPSVGAAFAEHVRGFFRYARA